MATRIINDTPEIVRRWHFIALGVALLGSLCTEIKVPGDGIGLQNFLLPAAGLAMVLLDPGVAVRIWPRNRPVLVALAALVAWSFTASALGLFPTFSIYYWVKYQVLTVLFIGFLCLLDSRPGWNRAFDLVIGFLLVLAVLGTLEVIFPGSAFLRLFRSDSSLTMYPRVASVLPWPNQYGVLMGIGALLTQLRSPDNPVADRFSWIVTIFFLTQVAQSGSRNAWLVVLFGLLWVVGRRFLSARRGLVLGVVFIAIVFVLPVSSRQTGLWDKPPVEATQFLLRENEVASTSLSPPGLSLSLRSKLWREGWAALRDHPLTGIGLDAFPRTGGLRVMGKEGFNTHNLPLNIAVELGLVGLVLASVFAIQLARNRKPGNRLAEVAVVMVIGGQIIDCFIYDATFMTLSCFFAAALITPPEEAS